MNRGTLVSYYLPYQQIVSICNNLEIQRENIEWGKAAAGGCPLTMVHLL